MIAMLEPMMTEIQQEAATTRRVLERIPSDKLSWRPHPKSMSLGELGLHVANIPGGISKLAQLDEFDAGTANFEPPSPKDAAEILAVLESSIQSAQQYLASISEPGALANWRLTANGQEIFNISRIAMIRMIMLNHWYHHRGQLSVYLRLLEVPVPAIYGRSADENPFGSRAAA
jgi:uncharacterized damage-inducible protein DinB